MTSSPDLCITLTGHVAHIEMRREAPGYIDMDFVTRLAGQLEALDADDDCRAIVLSSAGKAFCAGADFGGVTQGTPDPGPFYQQAMRLFRTRKPIVAAVQGAAIGAGLGLALVADFRVAGPSARLSANFNRLGIHPGFGLTLTLPRLVGEQQAALLFFTGRRIDGAEAQRVGLADELVADAEVLPRALALAAEIAESSPAAVESTRASLRLGLAERIAEVNRREREIQIGQMVSADFREGVAAMAARRPANFTRT
ncbi:enoyl-CoA hydratase/isomerase family protein [Variovorax sp. dw_308]|uniref:enoyl-CoA hydratase/isomerase family protein n=1 Tax=Variovorax sp. dw_308 TaxID=2721546 RepID=UPI001C457AD3|nr:enoyl-CoA hydratase/isomerase family protein [Variovorax sp. dw_308]